MAKARTRAAARKVKDKWKGKAWYDVEAPIHFGRAKIAETLADDPQKLVGRIAETTLQDLTGDFKQMHVKLQFRIDRVDGTVAHSSYAGHSLTSDYLRRMTRRNHSKVDAVVEVTTKDRGVLRVKPFTVSDKRSQTTQERALRSIMAQEIQSAADEASLNRLVRDIVDGKLAARIAKACRPVYPVRRVEIQKTEVRRLPQVELDEDWEAEFAEKEEEEPQPEAETPSEGEESTEESEAEATEDQEEGEKSGEAEPDADRAKEEQPPTPAAGETSESDEEKDESEIGDEAPEEKSREVTAERKE